MLIVRLSRDSDNRLQFCALDIIIIDIILKYVWCSGKFNRRPNIYSNIIFKHVIISSKYNYGISSVNYDSCGYPLQTTFQSFRVRVNGVLEASILSNADEVGATKKQIALTRPRSR